MELCFYCYYCFKRYDSVKAFGGKSSFLFYPLMIYFVCKEGIYSGHLYVRVYYNQSNFYWCCLTFLSSLIMSWWRLNCVFYIIRIFKRFWILKNDEVALGSAYFSAKSVISCTIKGLYPQKNNEKYFQAHHKLVAEKQIF